MKRFLLIPLAMFVLAATCLPAQQASGNKNSASQTAKRPPQAKTKAEFDDYQAAYAITGGAAMEKAADDFAAKYPKSELRAYLYAKAMHEYENDPAKILVLGDKVLALDPDHVVALILTSTVLSDSLTENPDPAKVATIKKNVNHALEVIESTPPPGGVPNAEQTRNIQRAMAHSALGITALKSGDNGGAEKELKLAADLGKAQPDPFVWYHLALSQDREGTAAAGNDEQQKKYADALVSIREALRYTSSNPDLGKLAEGELKRLQQLTGQESGTTAPAQPQPSPSQQHE